MSTLIAENRRLSTQRDRDRNVNSESRRNERKSASPSFSSVVLAVLFVVLLLGALPSHGLSTASPVASTSAASSLQEDIVLSEEDCVRGQLGYLPSNYVGVSAWKKKAGGSSHRRGVQIAASSIRSTSTEPQNKNTMIPVAIQTYPLNGGAKRRQNKAKLLPTEANQESKKEKNKKQVQSPFPTLFWLTCPDISKAVANIEGRGFVTIFEDELNADAELSQRLFSCHEEYAQLRWKSLTEEDRSILKGSSDLSSSPLQRMRNMMECSGISGTNFTDISSWDSDYYEREAAAAATTTDIATTSKTGDGTITVESLMQPVVPKVPPIKCLHAHYAHYRSTVSLKTTRHVNPVGELIHKQLQRDFPDLDL